MASMTNRERVLAALRHEETDRVPIDFGGCYSTGIYFTAYEKLKNFLGLEHDTVIGRRMTRCVTIDESVLRRFDVDTRILTIGPYEGAGNQREIDEDGYADELGAVWRKVGDGPYLNVDGPFYGKSASIGDLENHTWPDPDDPGYTRGLRERARALRENTDCAIVLNLPSGVVHTSQWLRGYEAWLKDLYKNRDYACRLMDLITDWWVRIVANALDAAGEYIDVTNFGDDLGTQQSTLFDPKIYRELVKPRHARMFATIKERSDAKILFHSCGAVSKLFDDFIDVGIDVVNPVQVRARDMEPDRLKAEFGDRLAFWGAIDTQRVLPFGTPDEVRAEVRRVIDILGRGGGYVLNSVHNIQAEVPPENIVAMFDEARSYRPGGA
jgi:uroporphyrinogen decarboxylase